MAAKYDINGEQFATKRAVLDRIRAIRDRHQDTGADLDAGDLAFMLGVLGLHPEAGDKIGCGVRRMWVQVNPPHYTTAGFWVERVDGSRTDFSFIRCLTPAAPRADLIAALRTEVFQQVQDFKLGFFARAMDPACPYTGVALDWGNSHVDHVAPATFDKIAGDWIAASGIQPGEVSILGFGDGEVLKSLADDGLAESWREYHRANCVLRVISARANLSHAKRGRNHHNPCMYAK